MTDATRKGDSYVQDDAKATSPETARRFGAALRRAFAPVVSSPRLNGTGAPAAAPALPRVGKRPSRKAPSHRRPHIVLIASALAALALLLPSAALALQTHKEMSSIDGSTVPNTAFGSLGGLAVGSGGDLYATDQTGAPDSTGAVQIFDSTGTYLSQITGANTPQGALSFFEPGFLPAAVAVDDSGGPSDGNVYVTDTGNGLIDAFDPATNELLASFGNAGQLNGNNTPSGSFSLPCGLAVDQSNGDLYVADWGNNRIRVFDSTGAYQRTVFDSTMNAPCGLAIDATDTLFVRNQSDGKVLRFDSSGILSGLRYDPTNGTPGDESDDTPRATAVAVDPGTNHLYIDVGSQVRDYEQFGGGLLATLGPLSGSYGTAADFGVGGKVYVSDGASLRTFSAAITTIPDATTGAATDISATAATLNGTVDAAGGSEASCEFEYDTDGSYTSPATVPCEPAGPYPGFEAVHTDATGLTAATTYHYRIHATNVEIGSDSYGADRTFETAGPPAVSRTFVTGVDATTATLNADLNPDGAATSWRFEYVDQQTFEASGFATAAKAPVPDAELEAGAPLTVSQPLSGLQPDTRYRYRLIATNPAGPLTGPERGFKTDPILGSTAPGRFPGQGFLPDNRAWEMVTPPDKNGGTANAFGQKTVVSPDGDRIAYAVAAAFGDVQGTGAAGTTQYVASRGGDGWSSHAMTPKTDPSWPQLLSGVTSVLFNPGLTRALVRAYDLPQVSGDIAASPFNLYREDAQGSANLTPVTPGNATLSPFEIQIFGNTFYGGSSNLDRVYFASRLHLLPEAGIFRTNIYEWNDGMLRLAGVLPDGSIPPGGSFTAIPESAGGDSHDAVSTDGSRVLFGASMGGPQQLLMRKDHTSTTWVSEPEEPGPEPEGVSYQYATPDLHRVAFTSSSPLTSDDPGGPGEALYIYTDSPDPENEQNLEFVYRSGGLVTVEGMNGDASRGFFYAENGSGEGALYRWDGQGVHKVVDVQSGDGEKASLANPSNVHSVGSGVRVSANGRAIAFLSNQELTDAELGIIDLNVGFRARALYVYDADTDKLVCASCPPSGEAASGETWTFPGDGNDGGVGSQFQRNAFLSADGRRAFFSSPDPLVPEDTNGRYDAYEYDVQTGQPHLLSSGHSPQDSWFASASPSGDDAVIITSERLSAHDVDNAKDLYDARVGGGLPEPPPPPAQCEGDACQPPPLGLNDPTPASEGFAGPGDAKARHRHHRKRRRHHQHRANTDRRTSK
jgi:hypothetical protein